MAETFQGLPCVHLTLENGDSACVLLHGAHVVSWVTQGLERFYLSPKALFDGKASIRGGVPVCFPRFNQREPVHQIPKHGFARNLPWTVESQSEGLVTLLMKDSEATRRFWPQAFEARLRVELKPGSLQITLAVKNTDAKALAFSGALHTYFAVDGIAQTTLQGLDGQSEWDAVKDVHAKALGTLRFNTEFDRVYAATPKALTLRDGQQGLEIEQSASWAETIVWNPGPGKAMADLPEDGYQHFLCVEAAQVMQPVTLAPGAEWQGWQRLTAIS